MSLALDQAILTVENQVAKARKELAEYEGNKRRLINEVSNAQQKVDAELAELATTTAAKRAAILLDLPGLQETVIKAEAALDQARRELVLVRQAVKDAHMEAGQTLARANNVAKQMVSVDIASLDRMREQYTTFLAALPKMF